MFGLTVKLYLIRESFEIRSDQMRRQEKQGDGEMGKG